jgi:hypothetical protein
MEALFCSSEVKKLGTRRDGNSGLCNGRVALRLFSIQSLFNQNLLNQAFLSQSLLNQARLCVTNWTQRSRAVAQC